MSRYETPTNLKPSLTNPISSASFNPLPHLFRACTNLLAPRSLHVRTLSQAESLPFPTSSSAEASFFEHCAEAIAAMSRMKEDQARLGGQSPLPRLSTLLVFKRENVDEEALGL